MNKLYGWFMEAINYLSAIFQGLVREEQFFSQFMKELYNFWQMNLEYIAEEWKCFQRKYLPKEASQFFVWI